ncbi:MAG: DNA gyrase inhibitor YacG [Bacteriovoracaceae bacterium]|nr:DNA gyrase inhibitor YacG [Bacteriovoracaceae bacterium]
MKKELIVKCSHCEKEFSYYTSKFRPFCSERCKMVDLGRWLSEEYAIPVVKKTVEDAETPTIEEENENE